MKAKSKTPNSLPNEALATFEQLPEKTKTMLDLKEKSEKATGPTSDRIQKKIRKSAKTKSPTR
jgi:hypothetical protein